MDILRLNKIVKVQIDGSVFPNSKAAWAVVMQGAETKHWEGQLYTSSSAMTEKIALAMALLVIPRDIRSLIHTDAWCNLTAFYRPDLRNEIDQEITILRKERPLAFLAKGPVPMAHLLARKTARGSERG